MTRKQPFLRFSPRPGICLLATVLLLSLATGSMAQDTPYNDGSKTVKPETGPVDPAGNQSSPPLEGSSEQTLAAPAGYASSAPPDPIPLDKPVGKEISMASKDAKTWFDNALAAADWEFPEGVINKYGQTISREDFFKAIIWIESNGVHRSPHGKLTKSWVGAMGFGQLMPRTAKGLGIKADDAASNLKGSSKYLKEIFSAKNVSESTGMEKLLKACCAYNMGPYSSLLKHNWDKFKSSAPLETVGYGIKLKMCLGFQLTDWEKQKGAKLLGAKVGQMNEVADDFYARTHGLLSK